MSLSLVYVHRLLFYLLVLFNSNVLVYHSISYYFLLLTHKAYLLPKEKQEVVDLNGMGDGKELEGVDGEETIIRTYYMRKKSILKKNIFPMITVMELL